VDFICYSRGSGFGLYPRVDVLEEDVARLSPLKRERPVRCRLVSKKWVHINVQGRYDFSLSPVVVGGDLRPSCDPDAGRGLEEDE
jgi:hypothetical protein